jgi:glycosyltransferase involved in cell wall biosynthesis
VERTEWTSADNPEVRDVSVVIPVYRGEQSVPELVGRLLAMFEESGLDGEIILVNDGSPDGSWPAIAALAHAHANILGINLMRNYGQHRAILCGIRAARKSTIVLMDDDLQHRPEDLPRLIAKLNEGYDVVYGAPLKAAHPGWRMFLSVNIKRMITALLGGSIALPPSSYIAFRTQIRRAFDAYTGPDVVLSLSFAWSTTRIATISVSHDPRKYGRTTYNFRRLASMTLKMLTAYSIAPLRLASIIGFVFTLFGLGVFIYAVDIALTRHSVPGFPFLASLIALMSGAQLFTVGIIGEYLALMYRRSLGGPSYVVRERTDEIALVQLRTHH